MTLYPSPDYQTSFELIGLLVQEKRFNIDCQDGGHGSHLRYPIRTIYAILIYKEPLYFQFVCVEVLRPSQPNGVMSSAVSLPNHTYTGQA